MMNDKNLILAVVLSMAVLLLSQYLIFDPQEKQRQAAMEAERAAAAQAAGEAVPTAGDNIAAPTIAAGPGAPEALGAFEDRSVVLGQGPGRIVIDTPQVDGSLNLRGARFDDLSLKNYRQELDPDSPEVTLLHPFGAADAYYAVHGWAPGAGAPANLPGPDTVWEVASGARLTPETPVTLTYETGGLVFTRTISVDENFVFAIKDDVRNTTDKTVRLAPYGLINRHGIPGDLENFLILHEGHVGVFGGTLKERKYKKLINDGAIKTEATGGWAGITDKYWLTALIPPQAAAFTGEFKNASPSEAAPIFQSNIVLDPRDIPADGSISVTSHFFAGSKKVDILRGYEKPLDEGGLGVAGFDRAVDWGHLFFLTKPIFSVLNFLGKTFGNFGIAILLLTLAIKIPLFPLANKAYESMSKMKKLQPEMLAIRERHKDDKMKQQQEMMAMYQKEKLNPLAGCLPVLVQIPIFYALYKTLFVTIELRHQPFFGWVQDLSAPDPTSLFNLFGLLPYDPTAVPLIGAFLGIGVWPLLMGVGMYFQMKLNPPPADPIQQQVFALMPIFFVFLMANFAAGLVLYWTWNTVLSILQQWFIMRRMGVEVNWAENMNLPGFKKKEEASKEPKADAPAKDA